MSLAEIAILVVYWHPDSHWLYVIKPLIQLRTTTSSNHSKTWNDLQHQSSQDLPHY